MANHEGFGAVGFQESPGAPFCLLETGFRNPEAVMKLTYNLFGSWFVCLPSCLSADLRPYSTFGGFNRVSSTLFYIWWIQPGLLSVVVLGSEFSFDNELLSNSEL